MKIFSIASATLIAIATQLQAQDLQELLDDQLTAEEALQAIYADHGIQMPQDSDCAFLAGTTAETIKSTPVICQLEGIIISAKTQYGVSAEPLAALQSRRSTDGWTSASETDIPTHLANGILAPRFRYWGESNHARACFSGYIMANPIADPNDPSQARQLAARCYLSTRGFSADTPILVVDISARNFFTPNNDMLPSPSDREVFENSASHAMDRIYLF